MKQLIFLILPCLIMTCKENNKRALDIYFEGKEAFYDKRIDDAERFFNLAVKYDGNLLNARLMLSKIYYLNRDYNKALELQEEILNKNDSHIGALYWKAKTLLIKNKGNMSQEDTVIKCLQKILELDSHNIRARTILALIYQKNKKYNKALLEYYEIINEEKSILESRIKLYNLYRELGLTDKAYIEKNSIMTISKILKFHPAGLKENTGKSE